LLRALAIVPSKFDTSPGQRFRIEQWAPGLRAAGIDVTFEAFEDDSLNRVIYEPGHPIRKAAAVAAAFGRRMTHARKAREFDIVYVFREAAVLGPAVFERWIRRSGVPFIYDFDDAVFERYVSPSNGYLSLLKCPGKTAAICRLATHVIAGNRYLADYARRHNDRVTIVPTTIDTEAYQPVAPARKRVPVVGWSGSHSTVQHLRRIDTALKRLAATHEFRLKVIGTNSYPLDGVAVDAQPWRRDTETVDLAEIDIGVMPLPDDRWSRGKCGLKALQYMALGIPAICSPVGVNSEIIRHDENGLLASTEDEWVTTLGALLDNQERRERLGSAGRRTVEAAYSAHAAIPVVAQLFRNTAGARS